jgi:hypothetical protein
MTMPLDALTVLGAALAALAWFIKPRFRWSARIRVGRRRKHKLLPGVALVLGGFKTWRFGHRTHRRRHP